MKKIFTLITLVMCGLTASTAQDYVFVNEAGDIIEDGATITVRDAEIDAFGDAQLKSGLSVKNVGAPSNYQVRVSNEITRIDNGKVQVCFPTLCHFYTTVGKNKSEDTKMATDEVKDIQSEWFPDAYGECIVTYQAIALKSVVGVMTEKGGPTVTVHYIYADPAGVQSVKTDARPAEYYDLQGRQSVQPQRGISIVRMSDGSVRKVLNK